MSEHNQNRERAQRLMALSRGARADLLEAQRALKSAGNWGLWDMLGGGLFSTMVKHNRIDDARACIESARPHLKALQQGLGALDLDDDLQIQLGGFATFADYFFDSLFVDLHVQGKIQDLQQDVARTLGKLARVDSALRQIERCEAE